MTETLAADPAVPEPIVPKKNVFQRFAGVLFAPAETFEDIARKPDILAPLILLLVISYISTALVMPRMDFDAVMDAQFEQVRKQNPNLSEADVERMGRVGKAIGTVMGWLGPVLNAIWWVIVALVLLLGVRLFGGEGDFKQAFSATLYAWAPLTLFGIIMTIVIVARGTFDPTMGPTIVKSNPAFLVDMKAQPVLFSFLATLDVFTLWSVILMIFGFSALSKLSRGRTAAIVVSLWIALILIRVGFAAVGAMRAGA
ncbi:MAG TPA: Yip1 family protein [Thermoanaerobaculia bacterium]|nr:Yip1 family protein [Thermoanaerobaculia bacterium]